MTICIKNKNCLDYLVLKVPVSAVCHYSEWESEPSLHSAPVTELRWFLVPTPWASRAHICQEILQQWELQPVELPGNRDARTRCLRKNYPWKYDDAVIAHSAARNLSALVGSPRNCTHWTHTIKASAWFH